VVFFDGSQKKIIIFMIDNLKYNKDSYDIDYMYNEIVKRNIYERFYEVCDNDVVYVHHYNS